MTKKFTVTRKEIDHLTKLLGRLSQRPLLLGRSHRTAEAIWLRLGDAKPFGNKFLVKLTSAQYKWFVVMGNMLSRTRSESIGLISKNERSALLNVMHDLGVF